MRSAIKLIVVSLILFTLSFVLTPSVHSGGCGSSSGGFGSGGSSGCSSSSTSARKSEVIPNDVKYIQEDDQGIIQLEELGNQLTNSIADLEYRFSEIIDLVENDRLRSDLESVKRIVTTMRSDMSSYQFLSRRLLQSTEQTSMLDSEGVIPTKTVLDDKSH